MLYSVHKSFMRKFSSYSGVHHSAAPSYSLDLWTDSVFSAASVRLMKSHKIQLDTSAGSDWSSSFCKCQKSWSPSTCAERHCTSRWISSAFPPNCKLDANIWNAALHKMCIRVVLFPFTGFEEINNYKTEEIKCWCVKQYFLAYYFTTSDQYLFLLYLWLELMIICNFLLIYEDRQQVLGRIWICCFLATNFLVEM